MREIKVLDVVNHIQPPYHNGGRDMTVMNIKDGKATFNIVDEGEIEIDVKELRFIKESDGGFGN